ncbi:ANTAR domain-containing protein [Nocardia sp. NPDC050697]|uniref:ANTAR domain-containing protein n=1 Tax=Nocardia sp. NPDC050697 TaxID=3155158 RepID=UPI0033EEB2A2
MTRPEAPRALRFGHRSGGCPSPESVHPDDRPALAAALRGGGRFCLRLRLPEGDRTVVVVGAAVRDAAGALLGAEGYTVDLTEILAAEQRAAVDEALPEYARGRGVLEQAAGMLMLIYRIDAGRAAGILEWRAAETGLPVTELARRLCAAATAGFQVGVPLRRHLDDLLLGVDGLRDPGATVS